MREIICLILFTVYAIGIIVWLYKDKKALNSQTIVKDKIIAVILLVAGYILTNTAICFRLIKFTKERRIIL